VEEPVESKIEVLHVSLELSADFDEFTRSLEQLLGRFDPNSLRGLDADPQSVEERLKASEGEEGLMLFDVQDHGQLLNVYRTPKKAKQYVLGNPLIAITMTRHDIRAGLYAPLRMFVYESGGRRAQVEYDQPSSLFGQFGNPDVTSVAQSLDAKLRNLIKKAERLAKGIQEG
jgi:uncharacterized protein (DUF302 family)